MGNPAEGQLNSKIIWAFTALVMLITWFGLVLQFSISIPAYLDKGCSLISALIQLFSFYTILSNLLMVIALTAILIAPKSACGRFFSKGTTLTSIVLYMTIVGLTYNILLRNIWQPEGLFKLADELLHVVLSPDAGLIFDAGFSPRLDYYTGLVFEMTGINGTVLASGGQYDRLLERLGAGRPVTAAGCALWVNRLESEARE